MHSSLVDDLRAFRTFPLLTASEEPTLSLLIQAWLGLEHPSAAESLPDLAQHAAPLQSHSPQPLSVDQLGATPGRLAMVMGLRRRRRPLSFDRAGEGQARLGAGAEARGSSRLELRKVRRSRHLSDAVEGQHQQQRQLGPRERAVLSAHDLVQQRRPSLERIAECRGLTRSQIVHGVPRALRQQRWGGQAFCS